MRVGRVEPRRRAARIAVALTIAASAFSAAASETGPTPDAALGERAQQRLVERHAESLAFPGLVERCLARPAFKGTPMRDELAQWRQRRAATLADGAALIERIATAHGKTRAEIDAAIREQVTKQQEGADVATLDDTCARLRHTLRGEPELPLSGTGLDEDTRREVLDQLLPVATKLMACERIERVDARIAPPPVLRVDASSASAIADRVELWNAIGCGKALDIEVNLRFPEGEPPSFALGFPRTTAPAR